MERLINYILSRCRERSTWLGLFVIGTHSGIQLSMDDMLAISGLIITFLPDGVDLNHDGKIDTILFDQDKNEKAL